MVVVLVTTVAFGEPLERRYGSDHEHGYRVEREYDGVGRAFRNLDRAGYLTSKPSPASEVTAPRTDLHGPSPIGLQK